MFLIIEFFVKNYKFPLFFFFIFVNLIFSKNSYLRYNLMFFLYFFLKKLYFAVLLILRVLISDIWLIHAGVKGTRFQGVAFEN